MPRTWRVAWTVWALTLALTVWGVVDAPHRAGVGLLLRGSRVGELEAGSPAAAAGLEVGETVALAGGTGAVNLNSRLGRLRPGDSVLLERLDHGRARVPLVAVAPGAETVAWRLAWGLVAAGFLLLGAAVARRRTDRIGHVFFLWCTMSALAIAPRPAWPLDALAAVHDSLSSAAPLFIPPLLLHFFALFPEGRGQRRTAVARGFYALVALLAVTTPTASSLSPALADGLTTLAALVFAAGCVAALLSFAVSYRYSGPRHRRRLHVLLWSSVLGLLPLVAVTVRSNLGADPGGTATRAAALLLLLVPAGFAYAIEVHQVLDFRWRRDRALPARVTTVPSSPPVFPAGNVRSIVDAVATDLHSRLGLAHCGVYQVGPGGEARLANWLGDLPDGGVPRVLPAGLTAAAQRLGRPADLIEMAAAAGLGSAPARLADLERAGSRALLPIATSGRTAWLLALGPRLSDDLASPRHRAALSEYSAHAALAVENAQYHDERVEQARVSRELELARGIQERLLPDRDPAFPTLACAGASLPSGHVGGDYYDYVPLGQREFGVAVGDVCGKGVPAALLASHVQATLRRHAVQGQSPAGVLGALNAELASYQQPEKFVCMSYAVVDARSRTVTWASAGLNPPLWIRPGHGVHTLPSGDLILGVDPATRYTERTVHLEPGEGMVFLTDGVPDARRGQEDFGSRLLAACLERWAHLRPQRLRDRLLAEARAFHRTGILDDMTVVVLKAL
jgi:serine phosphatase RsbU (regulator of sigma subunit)